MLSDQSDGTHEEVSKAKYSTSATATLRRDVDV